MRASLSPGNRCNNVANLKALGALLEKAQLRTIDQYKDNQVIWEHLRNVRDEISQKEQKLLQAKEHIKQLETDLDSCHAQLFRSIPTYEVSDATISKEFTRLCENLTNWVEVLPEVVAFTDTFNHALEIQLASFC